MQKIYDEILTKILKRDEVNWTTQEPEIKGKNKPVILYNFCSFTKSSLNIIYSQNHQTGADAQVLMESYAYVSNQTYPTLW